MLNSEYWKRRFTFIEAQVNNKAAITYEDVEAIFIKAERELESKIQSWYSRFAKNNLISMAEAKRLLNTKELVEFKWDVKSYIDHGKNANLNPAWINQLENASAKFHISRLEALKVQTQQTIEVAFGNQLDNVDRLLKSSYLEGYYHTAFELQKGFKIGWNIGSIDNDKLKTVLSKPWTTDAQTFSDRIWKNKTSLLSEVRSSLTRNIMLGKAPDDSIKDLARKMNTTKNNAGRLIMTESAYFSSVSQRDSFNDLDVEQFEILETLDSETCDLCASLDGKVFKMEDFEAGVTAPPFHPWCRGCTAPYFEDDEGNIGQRIARNKQGETYYIPSNMKYPEWKEKFVDGGAKEGLDRLKLIDEGAIIETDEPFNLALTINDAENFAKNTLGIENVSYKGVDVDTANDWNKGLSDSFRRFPELKNNFGFVGEAHERNIMMKPVVKQYYLDELIKINPSFNISVLEVYADKEIEILMKSMQVSKLTYAQSWSPTALPFSKFKGVSVNGNWGKKSTTFVESLLNDVSTKFHPVGCDTIRSVLDHEIGHQLDDLLGISNLDDIQNLFSSKTHDELTDTLSRYAWDNDSESLYSEMIAEAWAEYCNNPIPREIAQTIGKIIEAKYKQKFG